MPNIIVIHLNKIENLNEISSFKTPLKVFQTNERTVVVYKNNPYIYVDVFKNLFEKCTNKKVIHITTGYVTYKKINTYKPLLK